MSYTTDPTVRDAFINGLRALADYLATHPDAPVPAYGAVIHLCAASTDDGGCAQVRRFARQLGATVEDTVAHDGHCEAVRSFGPIGYRMVAISDARMARHDAYTSYAGSVIP
jgi:hypothetical protein